MNLDDMSLKELKKLHKDVEKAIATFDDRRRREARERLEAQAKELGFTLGELLDAPKPKQSVLPPKFQHPENKSLTWTGMGRKPKWLVHELESGKELSDFAL